MVARQSMTVLAATIAILVRRNAPRRWQAPGLNFLSLWRGINLAVRTTIPGGGGLDRVGPISMSV